MNVNADLFTQAMAAAIKADTVFFISDVNGVKLNGEFQKAISIEEIKQGIEIGEITDGMIPKLNSSVELLYKGIKKIWIGNNLSGIDFNQNIKQEKNNGTWIVESKRVAI